MVGLLVCLYLSRFVEEALMVVQKWNGVARRCEALRFGIGRN